MAKAPERVEVHRTEDAMSRGVDVIAPQLGTDGGKLAKGEIDIRRMTRLNPIEIIAIAHFNASYTDGYYFRFMSQYMNLKTSEEGHERPKLLVDALKAIGGGQKERQQKRDDRNWVQRNVTKRNKGPDSDE
jgi:hypothetical protein